MPSPLPHPELPLTAALAAVHGGARRAAAAGDAAIALLVDAAALSGPPLSPGSLHGNVAGAGCRGQGGDDSSVLVAVSPQRGRKGPLPGSEYLLPLAVMAAVVAEALRCAPTCPRRCWGGHSQRAAAAFVAPRPPSTPPCGCRPTRAVGLPRWWCSAPWRLALRRPCGRAAASPRMRRPRWPLPPQRGAGGVPTIDAGAPADGGAVAGDRQRGGQRRWRGGVAHPRRPPLSRRGWLR